MSDVVPVGTVEISNRLGVARTTVDNWRSRNLGFPEPRWTVGGRPAWNWQDVQAWALATGRLDDPFVEPEPTAPPSP